MWNLCSHNTSGLYTNGIFNWYSECKFLYPADSHLNISALQARICLGKCGIYLFLDAFCLIDKSHQFFKKYISFFVHQFIALIGKCQRVFCKHQISLGRKLSWRILAYFPDSCTSKSFLRFILLRIIEINEFCIDSIQFFSWKQC